MTWLAVVCPAPHRPGGRALTRAAGAGRRTRLLSPLVEDAVVAADGTGSGLKNGTLMVSRETLLAQGTTRTPMTC